MNPYRRAALFVLRLSALGLMVIAIVLLGGEVLNRMAERPAPSSWLSLVLEVILLFAGIVLLIRAGPIAARWTDQFDPPKEKTLEELLRSNDES